DTLSAEVKPQGQLVLNKLIERLATREASEQKQYKIVVEGHTDSRPVTGGSFPSNWELSGNRASRVVRMFLDKGFNPKLLTAIGYADTHPEVAERAKDGRWNEESLTKNRRVVIRVLEPKMDAIPFPEAGNWTETEQAAAATATTAPTATPTPPAPA